MLLISDNFQSYCFDIAGLIKKKLESTKTASERDVNILKHNKT